MAINFQSARFLTSAGRLAQCPPDAGAEVAFCGRSNAGKSSAINALTRQKRLAKASKTPGRTRLLNFFHLDSGLDGGLRLVDLPGYGYARAPQAMQALWQAQIDAYLRQRQSLRALALLMDVRRPLQDFEAMTIAWCAQRDLPLHLLLTKADKLSRSAGLRALAAARPQLGAAASAQLFSATSGEGLEELADRLAELLLA